MLIPVISASVTVTTCHYGTQFPLPENADAFKLDFIEVENNL